MWLRCQRSVQECFRDFEYRLWNDQDIDDLIQQHYPQYWDLYRGFPVHIMQIDFARFCMLHRFGGIYMDLDIYCYQNFYESLMAGVSLIGNPLGDDPVENSLMASGPGHDFWIQCMELSAQRDRYCRDTYPDLYSYIETLHQESVVTQLRPHLVFYITGTGLVSSVLRSHPGWVDILPGELFNNVQNAYHPYFMTKHMHTSVWGRQNIEYLDKFISHYEKKLGMSLSEFDFQHDYSNEQWVGSGDTDLQRNASHDFVPPHINY